MNFRKHIVLFNFLGIGFVLIPQTQNTNPSVIPLPNSVKWQTGQFLFSQSTRLVVNGKPLSEELKYFNEMLQLQFGFALKTVTDLPQSDFIRFDEGLSDQAGQEAYEMDITSKGIKIRATSGGAGFFYAIQSLIQILSSSRKVSDKLALPCVQIIDQPRFEWRGMHLDVCRHFFPTAFIKKYIDLLALYKLNTFHWHLTDDQGWRIEIKKYPKLTSVGAWRKGSMIGAYSDHQFDTLTYGGFYTQEEIRDVVNYAALRHITVVPEIEMPGHSVAAIAAYPFLSCTGKPTEVEKQWGVFSTVFCSKDSVFDFLENVFSEVVTLFPGPFIHIGGDECPKDSWKHCTNCQARIEQEHLKNEHELQSYFITRIEKFLNSKGKQIIGWDEILEGGLAPNAAVMSWRGTEGGVSAARLKHKVVMSPGKPCYFDHYQSKELSQEPLAIGGFNPLDSVYAFEPMPKVLQPNEQKYVIGAQANLWTEYILNEKQAEYMAVPRMCAISEVLWTNPVIKNYSNFILRIKSHVKLLDKMQINYAKHFLKP